MMLVSLGCRTDEASARPAEKDIIATAKEVGDLDTLVTALKAADMVAPLEGEGPFTVFAPSDEAFAGLPVGKLNSLLMPQNKEELAGILKYHVVEGRLTADQIAEKGSLETLAGARLKVTVENGTVIVNGASLTKADIGASNGIIHVIDKVLMPPAAKNIVETATADKDLKTFVTALKAADLVEPLQDEGPFTVFAPTNAAFAKLPPGKLDSLLMPQNKEELAGILKYHVVEGRLTADQIAEKGSLETLAGARLKVTVENGKVMVDGASLTKADIGASNGIIHVIDGVVMPPEEEKEKTSETD